MVLSFVFLGNSIRDDWKTPNVLTPNMIRNKQRKKKNSTDRQEEPVKKTRWTDAINFSDATGAVRKQHICEDIHNNQYMCFTRLLLSSTVYRTNSKTRKHHDIHEINRFIQELTSW